jgi:hypothetical protein
MLWEMAESANPIHMQTPFTSTELPLQARSLIEGLQNAYKDVARRNQPHALPNPLKRG